MTKKKPTTITYPAKGPVWRKTKSSMTPGQRRTIQEAVRRKRLP